MNIDRKHLYIALIVIGLGLVVGPAFGLRMRSDKVKYMRLNNEKEQKITELEARMEEMKGMHQKVKQERDQTVAQQQKRVGEMSKAHQHLRTRNETLLLDMNEAKKQNQELLTGKNQLSGQLELISAEADELAKAKSQLSGRLELISAEAEGLAKAKKDREEALRNQQKLIDSLKNEIDAGQVKIARLAGLTTVRLEDKILFGSSKASIKESGLGVLRKIGEALQQIKDKHIQVQGHTDSRPLRWELQGKYPTNWELSAARAATIVRYLIDEVGIDPARLSAAGYAFYQPLASNDSPEGQRENRRVEFALLPLRAAPMDNAK
jgi:chemotaxis protein MotB